MTDTDEPRWVLVLIPAGNLTDAEAETIAAHLRALAGVAAAEDGADMDVPDDGEDAHAGAREES